MASEPASVFSKESSPPLHRTIEEVLFLPVPRRVRRRKERGRFLKIQHFIILPHMVIGVSLLGAFLYSLIQIFLMLVLGERVTGEVMDCKEHVAMNRHHVYEIHYAFVQGGGQRQGKTDVTASEYAQLLKGMQVQVKAFKCGPFEKGVLIRQGHFWLWDIIPFWVWIFGFVWNGGVFIFIYGLYILPLIQKGLVIHGSPVIGRVTQKKVGQGRNATHDLCYEFTPTGGSSTQGRMTVPYSDWNLAAVGQELTVLYAPDRPSRNMIYSCAEYEVDTGPQMEKAAVLSPPLQRGERPERFEMVGQREIVSPSDPQKRIMEVTLERLGWRGYVQMAASLLAYYGCAWMIWHFFLQIHGVQRPWLEALRLSVGLSAFVVTVLLVILSLKKSLFTTLIAASAAIAIHTFSLLTKGETNFHARFLKEHWVDALIAWIIPSLLMIGVARSRALIKVLRLQEKILMDPEEEEPSKGLN